MSEARATFIATLRAGLRGAPAESVDDVIGEYTAHFDEGSAANRSDEDIASALGDPLTLADELRVEMQIERWERQRSVSSAMSTIARIVGFGALDATLLFVVGPIVVLLALCTLILIMSLLCAGVWLVFAGSSLELPGGLPATLLAAAGSIFASISLAAFLALGTIGVVNALARYARLHYKFLSHLPGPGSTS